MWLEPCPRGYEGRRPEDGHQPLGHVLRADPAKLLRACLCINVALE